MFSKARNKSEGSVAPPPAKQQRPGRSAPSIVSADVVVVGSITSGGDIQIDGTVEGDVRSMSLTIGDKATINGDIYADDVVVRGRVMGSIRARRVQLCSTSHVEGNILHEALAVETGAYFEGNCKHSPDPLAGEEKSGKSGRRTSNGASRNGGGILGGFGAPSTADDHLDSEGDPAH